LTNIQHIGKEKEEEKEPQSGTHWQAASRDHDSVIHQYSQSGGQKKMKEETNQKPIKGPRAMIHKSKNIYRAPRQLIRRRMEVLLQLKRK
jgi:hypothetical protein